MRSTAFVFGLVLAFASLSSSPALAVPPTAEQEAKEEQAFQQAAALVAPAVVKIETVGGLDRVSGQLAATGPTTGVIVAADGWIISSAFNFITQPEQVLVTLADGRRLAAKLVATDRSKMLTLLKVDEQNLPIAQAAPPDAMRVGQWAIALGRTLEGESPSVSVGIISALRRIWGKAIQTDAKISPINYGGPLINIDGQVLGILVPLAAQAKDDAVAGVEWYDSGIGFAIPLTDIHGTLDRLKQGHDLLAGLLGITFKSQDEFAGEATLDRVRYGSPAQQAGLKTGDAVLSLDGKKISRIAQFRQIMGTKYAGDKVVLVAKRGDQEITANVTLVGEMVPYEFPFLGILPARVNSSLPADPGTKIRSVWKDSPAAQAGLKPADQILQFGDQAVTDSLNLRDRISRVRPGDTITLSVKTGTAEPRTVTLKLGSFPDAVPAELDPAFIVPPEKADKPAAEEEPKKPATGLITETFPGHDQDYWAYIPQDYNPAAQYGLIVWLHPTGETHEAAVLKAWKAHCEERGIILLAPKAKSPMGWTANEVQFIKELTEDFLKKYSIDRRRVAIHGMGSSGGLAYALAFQERAIYRAVLVIQTVLRLPPPDNEPDFSLQLFLIGVEKNPLTKGVKANADALRKLKFPVVYRLLPGDGTEYPAPSAVAEFARWLDVLDRI
ncbi:MAG: mucD 3 [Planctomycetaceae bacterium]|nr:mucD 3 [Planctomycetaceae bacterium]